jgi:predicted nucleotidyltransferase
MHTFTMRLPTVTMRHMKNETPKIVVQASRIELAIARRGYASVKDFAESVGLHRNTVSNYLSGKASLPDGLARILAELDLEPGDVLALSPTPKRVAGLAIADLVDTLHRARPDAAFALFGPRARGTAKRISDYDVGVFTPEGLEPATYSRLLDEVEDWNEASLRVAQLVDLGKETDAFLVRAAPDLVFLAGSFGAWVELLKRAGMSIHE